MRVSALGIVLALISVTSRAKAAETCGEKKSVVQQLMKHGYVAGKWPWHGAMYRRQNEPSYICGVTILTEQVVITVAHCTFDPHGERKPLPASRFFIKVGVTNLMAPDRHMRQHNIDRIIRHEEYNDGTFEDDIALMKLKSMIEFNNYVQPICLWQGDRKLDRIVSYVGYVVGWGYDQNNNHSHQLYEATMPIVSKRECTDSDPVYYRMHYFDSKTLCAGHRNGTQAAGGDSGGGLFLRFGEHWVLRGIVSTVKANPNTLMAEPTSFVVFTDASYYTNWIKSHVTINTRFETESRPAGVSESQDNLLNIASCGKDTYPSGTPEEMKRYLNQYPWLAVIEYINMNTRMLEDTCHGILIHPSFVVTAGNCVQDRQYSKIQSIRLNDYRLDTVNDIFEINGVATRTTATRIPVFGYIAHPNYKNQNFADNIALVKLARSTTANPICLPPKWSILPWDKKFSIIGWKRNSQEEKPMVRNVVQLADFDGCRRKYAEVNFALDSNGGHVCSTYSHDDDSENCSHYMGSVPLQYVRNGPFQGRYFLAAISNFGHSNCRRYEFPAVFTKVAHYADWIQTVVRNNE